MKKKQAVALMLALLLTTFLFVLGLGLLYFVERDSYVSLVQQRDQKAFVLARSGLMYARNTLVTSPASTAPWLVTPSTRVNYDVDLATPHLERFVLWVDGDTDRTLHSLGQLVNSAGTVLASRELCAPSYASSELRINQVFYDKDL